MFLMLFLVKAARCAGCGVDTLTPKLLRDCETGFKIQTKLTSVVAFDPVTANPAIADIDKDGNLLYILCKDPDCNATVTSSIVMAIAVEGEGAKPVGSAAAPVFAEAPLRGFEFGKDGLPTFVVHNYDSSNGRPTGVWVVRCDSRTCKMPATTTTTATPTPTTTTVTVPCPDAALDHFGDALNLRGYQSNAETSTRLGPLIKVDTVAECAAACIDRGADCVAFMHRASNSKCELLSQPSSHSSSVPNSNWRMFDRTNFCSDAASSTTAAAATATTTAVGDVEFTGSAAVIAKLDEALFGNLLCTSAVRSELPNIVPKQEQDFTFAFDAAAQQFTFAYVHDNNGVHSIRVVTFAVGAYSGAAGTSEISGSRVTPSAIERLAIVRGGSAAGYVVGFVSDNVDGNDDPELQLVHCPCSSSRGGGSGNGGNETDGASCSVDTCGSPTSVYQYQDSRSKMFALTVDAENVPWLMWHEYNQMKMYIGACSSETCTSLNAL
eukprot:gene23221-35501_t